MGQCKSTVLAYTMPLVQNKKQKEGRGLLSSDDCSFSESGHDLEHTTTKNNNKGGFDYYGGMLGDDVVIEGDEEKDKDTEDETRTSSFNSKNKDKDKK